MRPRQHDVIRRHSKNGINTRGDPGFDSPPFLGPGGASLGHHHQPLGPCTAIDRAEGGDAAPAHSGNVCRCGLHLLRDNVAAGLDDDVFGAAGDVQLAAGRVGKVARVHPAALGHDGGCGFRVPVVAARL